MGYGVGLVQISVPSHTLLHGWLLFGHYGTCLTVGTLLLRFSVREGAPGMLMLGECVYVSFLLCDEYIKIDFGFHFVKTNQQLILNTLNAVIIKMKS